MKPVRPAAPSTVSVHQLNSLFSSTHISPSTRCHVTTGRSQYRPRATHCRNFNTSHTLRKRKPTHKSISHAELEKQRGALSKLFPSYTASEKATLAKHYSPSQIAAIEASETAVADEDLANQAQMRRDMLRPQYMDTFARIEPIIDKKISKLRGVGQAPYLYKDLPDTAPMPDAVKMMSEEVALNREFYEQGRWYPDVNQATGETTWEWESEPEALVMRMMDEDPEGFETLRTRLAAEGKLVEQEYTRPSDGKSITEHLEALNLGPGKSSSHSSTDFSAAASSGQQSVPEDPLAPKPEGLGNGKVDIFNVFYNIKLREYLSQFEDASSFPGPLRRFSMAPRDIDKEPDVAPILPKIVDPSVRYARPADEMEDGNEVQGDDEETQAAYRRAAKVLGMTPVQMRSYRIRNLMTRRVVNQTRLGKIQSQYCLAVAGNGDGLIGLGEGKSTEPAAAKDMAIINALRNMAPILRYENRTIFGRVSAKVGAVRVELSTAKPGFGLRVSSHLYEIAKCAGIKDLSGRLPRGRTPMNVCKAVWEALRSQKNPEHVAAARGKKLVDVRKVYYSGLV